MSENDWHATLHEVARIDGIQSPVPSYDEARLVGLWREASRRGWVPVSEWRPGTRWAHPEGSSFTYCPGDDFGVATVEAIHNGRTLKVTGVESYGEAVDALRHFLGWPEPVRTKRNRGAR